MANVLLSFPNWVVTTVSNNPERQFALAFAGTGTVALLVGLWIGSFTAFGPAASGLILAVIAQGAEMYEQTIDTDTAQGKEAARYTKVFVGGMKMLGLILLGIGAMVGITPEPSSAPMSS
ncbi:hypothetical protein [Pseudarthrobacter chlorophenolicus]|uniref:hypothetical protein n=1 Tax=Pseudarthrobacter chlorophenolicus TaxID=85085 RepID=UPI0005F2CEB1|nr:hypothetical protein [Pseudarthrobacter chlorophenolicus]